MNDSAIIDALGGTAEVARLCNVRPPSVSEWRVRGIPAARRMYLEVLRPDVFGGETRGMASRDGAPVKGAA